VSGKSAVPAPQQIQLYLELLQKLFKLQPTPSNQQTIIKLLNKILEHNSRSKGQSSTEIVHIRGFEQQVEDVFDEESLFQLRQFMQSPNQEIPRQFQGIIRETTMWNPLHFAVYGGHFEVVKYMCQSLKVNIAKSAPKQFSENEGDPVNDEGHFVEDQLFLLQMSLVKQRIHIFEFLLEEYAGFWPKNLFEDWFQRKLTENKLFTQEQFLEVIRIYFRSKTAKSLFSAMTYKK